MKKHIITALIATTLSSLLSACSSPDLDQVPLPGSVAPDNRGSNEYRITIVDEKEAPRAMMSVSYGTRNRSNSSTAWKVNLTDFSGNLGTSCTGVCDLEVHADGYWSYKGPYLDPARIQLAARTEEERNGKKLNTADYELFRIHLAGKSKETDIESFASLFNTNVHSNQSTFQVGNEEELKPVLTQLARIGSGTQHAPGSSGFGGAEANGEALMRKALAQGKRLVGYSNNEFFRYLPTIEELHQTADSYYFSENRTRLLSDRGMSGHSYDYELIVYALPADGKTVIFHGKAGKLGIAP